MISEMSEVPIIKLQLIIQGYEKEDQSLKLTSANWERILMSRPWTQLKHQIWCKIIGSEIKLLTQFEWPNLQSLLLGFSKIMKMEGNVLHNEGIEHLLLSSWPALQVLGLGNNWIRDKGIKSLLQTAKMPKLSTLVINKNQFTLKDYKPICESTTLTNLSVLYLYLNNIGSKGVKSLIKIDLPNLSDLHLCMCNLNNEGIKHVVKNNWKKLKVLALEKNHAWLEAVLKVGIFFITKFQPNLVIFLI